MAVQLPDTTGEPAESRCLFCGEPVTKDFRRVFGDDQDRAHRCPECDISNRIEEGSAAGLEPTTRDPATDPQKRYHVNAAARARADGGQEVDR